MAKRRKEQLKYSKIIKIQDILNSIYDTTKFTELNRTKCLEVLKIDSDKLLDIWLKSDYKDYNIYLLKEYIAEGFICFYHITEGTCKGFLEYFQFNDKYDIDLKSMKIFDDYNGIGMSTMFLLKQGLDVSYHNTNNFQIDTLNKLCEMHDIKKPKNDLTKSGKYDIVLSFEIAEHFLNPLEYWNSIKDMINEDGYLIICTGFGPKDYPGHFKNYNINGAIMNSSKACKILFDVIKGDGFEEVWVGFNKKPRVFKKKKQLSNLVEY